MIRLPQKQLEDSDYAIIADSYRRRIVSCLLRQVLRR